jgi:hypothetical protein
MLCRTQPHIDLPLDVAPPSNPSGFETLYGRIAIKDPGLDGRHGDKSAPKKSEMG